MINAARDVRGTPDESENPLVLVQTTLRCPRASRFSIQVTHPSPCVGFFALFRASFSFSSCRPFDGQDCNGNVPVSGLHLSLIVAPSPSESFVSDVASALFPTPSPSVSSDSLASLGNASPLSISVSLASSAAVVPNPVQIGVGGFVCVVGECIAVVAKPSLSVSRVSGSSPLSPTPSRNQLFRLRRCNASPLSPTPSLSESTVSLASSGKASPLRPQPRPDRNLWIRLHQMETRRRYRVSHPRRCLEGCQGCHLRPNQRTFHSTPRFGYAAGSASRTSTGTSTPLHAGKTTCYPTQIGICALVVLDEHPLHFCCVIKQIFDVQIQLERIAVAQVL